MGTVRCRYPSAGVPLLAFHRDSEWSVGAACALSRAWQGGHGELQSRMHEDAGGIQGQRSPVYPHLSCKVQSPPAAPGWVMGQAGGLRHCGNSVAQPQRRQPHCLPTPTVSQRCLFFPSPRTLHGASSSFPSYLGDFNPAAPTGCKKGCLHQRCARDRRQSLSLLPEPPELVAQGEAGLAVPGHGCTPAAGKVTLQGHPSPLTHTPCMERGTQDPIPAAAQSIPITAAPHSNPSPISPIPLVPRGSLDLHLPPPLDPTALLPPTPLSLQAPLSAVPPTPTARPAACLLPSASPF